MKNNLGFLIVFCMIFFSWERKYAFYIKHFIIFICWLWIVRTNVNHQRDRILCKSDLFFHLYLKLKVKTSTGQFWKFYSFFHALLASFLFLHHFNVLIMNMFRKYVIGLFKYTEMQLTRPKRFKSDLFVFYSESVQTVPVI